MLLGAKGMTERICFKDSVGVRRRANWPACRWR